MLTNNPEFSGERMFQPPVKPIDEVLADIARSHGQVVRRAGDVVLFENARPAGSLDSQPITKRVR